jgi:hypothetical protein
LATIGPIGFNEAEASLAELALRITSFPPATIGCLHIPFSTNTRSIFDFSAENAKITDWLAERTGFELAVPLVSRDSGRFLQICYLRGGRPPKLARQDVNKLV